MIYPSFILFRRSATVLYLPCYACLAQEDLGALMIYLYRCLLQTVQLYLFTITHITMQTSAL